MRVILNKISREIKYNIDLVVKFCICGYIFLYKWNKMYI